MKKMDLFCTSRASTAVCSSLDRRPTSGHDRHHRLYDGRKLGQLHVPCLSQLPINPKPQFEKHRKSSYSTTSKQYDDHVHNLRRKSSADVDDLKSSLAGSSSRYLLADSPFIDWLSESSAEGYPPLIPDARPEERKILTCNGYHAPKSASLARSMTVHEYRGLKSPSSSRSLSSKHHQSPALRTSSSARSRDQVVVLKVSLHCKGCEEKVKRHLSKMEGVTSFSVDFTTKKVTIIGDVTPLSAVASVSKVKHAQLWPSPSPSSASSSSSSSSTPQSSLLSF